MRASSGELHVSVYNATARGSPFRVQLHADDADVRHNAPPETRAGKHGSLNVTSLLGADYLVRKLAWSWWAWDYVPDFHAKLVCASAECHSAADSTKRTRVEYDESHSRFVVEYRTTRAGRYKLQLQSSAGQPVGRPTDITVLPDPCDLTRKLPTLTVECPCERGRPVRFSVKTYDQHKNPTRNGAGCQLQKEWVKVQPTRGTRSVKIADSFAYNDTSLQFEGKFTGLEEPGEYVLWVSDEQDLNVEKKFRVARGPSS